MVKAESSKERINGREIKLKAQGSKVIGIGQ
jgi:hypothetical protein